MSLQKEITEMTVKKVMREVEILKKIEKLRREVVTVKVLSLDKEMRLRDKRINWKSALSIDEAYAGSRNKSIRMQFNVAVIPASSFTLGEGTRFPEDMGEKALSELGPQYEVLSLFEFLQFSTQQPWPMGVRIPLGLKVEVPIGPNSHSKMIPITLRENFFSYRQDFLCNLSPSVKYMKHYYNDKCFFLLKEKMSFN